MNLQIQQKLHDLAAERGVKVLYACESGSRAWGFPSPDSDYDVRFIYAEPTEWYVSLQQGKDTLDFPIDDELDFAGWELRKMLLLLKKSNAAPLEWMQSSMVYHEEPGFLKALQPVANHCFSPISCSYHYLHTARAFVPKVIGPKLVKLKGLFYLLRNALAGAWIREHGSVPPLWFPDKLDLMPERLAARVRELIELKATKPESYLHPADPELSAWLLDCLNRNEGVAASLPGNRVDLKHLDNFYRNWIGWTSVR